MMHEARIVCEKAGFFPPVNKAVSTCSLWIYAYEENRKVDDNYFIVNELIRDGFKVSNRFV